MHGDHRRQSSARPFACAWLALLLVSGGVEADTTIIDNEDPGAFLVGRWRLGKGKDAYDRTARYSRDDGEFVFAPALPPGQYRVKLWWPQGRRLSGQVPVTVLSADGPVNLELDQSQNGGRWNMIGDFRLDESSEIRIRAVSLNFTSADAVMFESVEVDPPPPSTEDPVVQDPVVQDPVVQDPVVQDPVVQDPVVDDPPLPPADLSATVGDGLVALDWSDSPETDLAGYAVYRSGAADGEFALLAGGLSASTYTDREVSAGLSYFYFVTASDQAGNTSGPSSVVTAEMPPPDRSAHLAWNAPLANEDGSELTDLRGFHIHIGNQPGEFTGTIDVGMALEYRFESLEPGVYYFSVTAYDGAGNESLYPDAVSKEIR